MKKIITTLMIVLCFLTINAQESNFKFDANSGTLTESKFKCEGKIFDVYTIGNGINYVKCVSLEADTFACWIGYPTEYMFRTHPVWQSKDGTEFCFFLLNDDGYPYSIWLEKIE